MTTIIRYEYFKKETYNAFVFHTRVGKKSDTQFDFLVKTVKSKQLSFYAVFITIFKNIIPF